MTFVKMIRGEIAFSSVKALIEQIGQDVAHVREFLGGETMAGCVG